MEELTDHVEVILVSGIEYWVKLSREDLSSCSCVGSYC